MSPAFCLAEGYTLKKAQPLRLRYGFHVHAKDVSPETAGERLRTFAATAAWAVVPAERPWRVALRRAGA